jgi:hypothetical protein
MCNSILTNLMFLQDNAHLAQLSVFAVNFAHKATAALLLGFYMYVEQSATQVVTLVVLQTWILVYFLITHPYVDTTVQTVEVFCHSLELVLFTCATTLLFGEFSIGTVHAIEWTMIGECGKAVCHITLQPL